MVHPQQRIANSLNIYIILGISDINTNLIKEYCNEGMTVVEWSINSLARYLCRAIRST